MSYTFFKMLYEFNYFAEFFPFPSVSLFKMWTAYGSEKKS